MHMCVTLVLCTLHHSMVCHPVSCVNLCMSLGKEAEPAAKVVSRWRRPRMVESLRNRLRKKRQWSRCQLCVGCERTEKRRAAGYTEPIIGNLCLRVFDSFGIFLPSFYLPPKIWLSPLSLCWDTQSTCNHPLCCMLFSSLPGIPAQLPGQLGLLLKKWLPLPFQGIALSAWLLCPTSTHKWPLKEGGSPPLHFFPHFTEEKLD